MPGLAGTEICRPTTLNPTEDTVYTLTTSNTSPAIAVGKASFGALYLVTNTSTGNLTAYASQSTTGSTFEVLRDSTGTAVEIPMPSTTTGWIELPSACLSVPFLQLRLSNNAGTARIYLKG